MNTGMRDVKASAVAPGAAETLPLVAAIILNWNGEDLTLQALQSLSKQHYSRLEAIVVDNGSRNQAEAVRRIRVAFPATRVIENAVNLGFAGGCNVGIEAALEQGANYVLLLNSDVTLDPTAIGKLVEAMEHDSRLGAVSPLIYYAAQPEHAWFAGGTIVMGGRVAARHDAIGQITAPSMEAEPRLSDWLPGTAMLVRGEAIRRSGMMDRAYFLYWEDVDWCVRLRQAGYRLAVIPAAHVWHAVNASTSKLPRATVYYWERNRLRFIERWGTPRSRLIAWGKILWRLAAWHVRLPTDDPTADVKLAAYRDYMRRRFGQWEVTR